MLRLEGRPVPVVGRARYVCGITPYDTTHLGHAATFVWGDVAARVLRHAGVDVEVCRNVTDVDDVLDAAAARAGSRFDSFAAVQQFRFDRDMAALGCAGPRTSRARTTSCRRSRRWPRPCSRPTPPTSAVAPSGSGADVAARAGLAEPAARALAREFGEDLDDVGRPGAATTGRTSRSGGRRGRAPGRPSPRGPARGATDGRAGTPSARRWP